MSDEPKERSWAWIWWALVTSPVLYVLSVGPAEMLYQHGVIDLETGRKAYAPLEWLCEHSSAGQRITARAKSPASA